MTEHLLHMIGTARCLKGSIVDEPMRVHQPEAFYNGALEWLNGGECSAGSAAQHGYYREISDCETVRLAYTVKRKI